MALNQLSLSLQFARDAEATAHRATLPRHAVARWIRHALAVDAEITVRIVGAEEGQRLNREFRHKDYATNVLTFDYQQEPWPWPIWCSAPPWSSARPASRTRR